MEDKYIIITQYTSTICTGYSADFSVSYFRHTGIDGWGNTYEFYSESIRNSQGMERITMNHSFKKLSHKENS